MSLYGGIELPDRPDPENVRKLDLLPIPMIRAMQRWGMRIDPEHFRELSSRLESRMADLRCEIVNEIPAEALDKFVEATDVDTDDNNGDGGDEDASASYSFNVESSERVAGLLYETLGLGRQGIRIKKTKSGDRLTTGKKTLEQLKREHPVVPFVLEYRECSKLCSTYAKALPRRALFHSAGKDCPQCGRLHWTNEYRTHTKVMTTRAATGRTTSKDPNLGNIPIRTKLGAEIRAGFIASNGHVIAQRDWAQIELRLLADRSGDEKMIAVYREDGDIHIATAMGTFNISDPSKVDKLLHRAPAKNVNFAVAYLITEDGLLDLMAVTFATAGVPLPFWMTKQWCKEFIDKWFGLYTGVRRYLDDEESKIRRFAIAWTRCGRVRRVPEVRSCHSYIQEAGVRQGGNHGIQGYSADIMKLAMGELWDRLQVLAQYGIETYPLMTIYDELLVECAEDDGETVEAAMGEVMDHVLDDRETGVRQCRVPIKSDGKIMERWMKE